MIFIMKIKFITALQKVRISEDLDRGDKFRENLYVTNNSSFIRHFLSDVEINLIGNLNYEALCKWNTFVYLNSEVDSENVEIEIVNIIRAIKSLCNASWFIKDNCMNCEDAFLFYAQADRTYVHSNFVNTIFTQADGNYKTETVLSREELRASRKLFHDHFADSQSYSDSALTTFNENYTRVSRSILFLQAARTCSDLGIKVANCVGALEALFCGTTNEIAHQLSERIAVFTCDDTASKLATYYLVKNAYSIRSSVVHGDIISKKRLSELKKTSVDIDEILRNALYKIISNKELSEIFNGSTEKLNDYFLKKIFS